MHTNTLRHLVSAGPTNIEYACAVVFTPQTQHVVYVCWYMDTHIIMGELVRLGNKTPGKRELKKKIQI